MTSSIEREVFVLAPTRLSRRRVHSPRYSKRRPTRHRKISMRKLTPSRLKDTERTGLDLLINNRQRKGQRPQPSADDGFKSDSNHPALSGKSKKRVQKPRRGAGAYFHFPNSSIPHARDGSRTMQYSRLDVPKCADPLAPSSRCRREDGSESKPRSMPGGQPPVPGL
jgi:hypothetical protein